MNTARGNAPPVKGMAAPRLKATAPAGAMVVTDWNRTPGRPIAFDRSVVSCTAPSGGGVTSSMDDIITPYLYIHTYLWVLARRTRSRKWVPRARHQQDETRATSMCCRQSWPVR